MAELACAHCGLPVPSTWVAESESAPSFCCLGCQTVYALLHEQGLTDYYQFIDGDERRPARVSGRSYAEFDDPMFMARYGRIEGDLASIDVYLEGVHCTACVWLVERLPKLLKGVAATRLDLGRSVARLHWQPTQVSLSSLAQQLDRLGYPVHPWRAAELQRLRRREDRKLLMRIGVAGAVAGNVMLMAFALYAGMFSAMGQAERQLFRWASLIVSLPSLLWSALPFFRGAWGAMRAKMVHMDVPVALGLLVGYVGGAVNTWRGRGEIYFDSLTVLVFLLLVGRWLQQRQQRRAADATELLCSITPTSARIIEGQHLREVPLEAVVPGMLVELRAGDSVPVDGTVCEGASTIDASLLTGESRPVEVRAGDLVHAGMVNLRARLVVEVVATGEETRVGRLMQRVADYARRRAPIVQMADRLAGRFVSAAVGLAALTVMVWWHVAPSLALEHAMALLIVTCPCALGLATPLAVSVAIGRAARAGILVKGGDALEQLARCSTIMLDKTGTLTTGRMTLVDWCGDVAVKPDVVALERHSAHYLARALVEGLADSSSALAPPVGVYDVQEQAGAGIEGKVEGVTLRAGSVRWLEQLGLEIPRWLAPVLHHWAQQAYTPVVVARDTAIVAAAALGDLLRPGALPTLDRLRQQGHRLELLSGDHPLVVSAVADRLGIVRAAAHGAMIPEEKLAYVQAAALREPVVMVGDGINDAGALAAAHVGVAMHGGAEASLEVADVYVARGGVAALAELLEGARRTMRVIRRNLIFSLCYNLLGAGLAISGVLHPLLAALLMPASSLTVVFSSYRAHTFAVPGSAPVQPTETITPIADVLGQAAG